MSSSKIILIGAISVVFGLYNLSLTKVNGMVGSRAEIAMYLAKASDNARTGVEYALYDFERQTDSPSFSLQLDSSGVDQGSFFYTATFNLVGSIFQLTVTSHGVYKSPREPVAFQGHEVIMTAYAEFSNKYSSSSNDVKLKAVYSSVNYARERQLDSLQLGKSNLIGY
jgi:hypothetical protein